MKRKIFILLLLIGFTAASQAQEVQRPQPKFWFGVSAAANLNFYSGTTQTLNSMLKAPGAFHDGFGVGPYGSVLMEYRPNQVFGLMLNLAYDGRGAKFDGVDAPCNCPETLNTKLAYLTVEPSIRIAPFKSGLYLFFGGVLSHNINKSFSYTQLLKPDATGDFSEVRTNKLSAQVGAGYDIPLSPKSNPFQVSLSPFVSYHPYFGQEPRSVESWSLQTVRVGVALKFGKGHVAEVVVEPVAAVVVPEPEVDFTIEAPAKMPAKRKVKETFPIRNYVFFDGESQEIPGRYVRLEKDKANIFVEAQIEVTATGNNDGRSHRQLNVYYNVLNVLGARMRENPTINVTLIGSSAGKGAKLGKKYAESIKIYLVDEFGIDEARIKTEGRNQPIWASERPGGNKELVLLREDDLRVDIVSSSPIALAPLQIVELQEDKSDNPIIFRTGKDGKKSLESWSLELKDEKGAVQNFGPYTNEEESISGNVLLGDKDVANYTVVLIGKTKNDVAVRKASSLHLIRNEEPTQEGLRFSVLFDFNKPKTVDAYEKFLIEDVVPLVPDNATVIVHGHTDAIGSDDYNMKLSKERANDIRNILESSLNKAGKKGIKFEENGYGEDVNSAPFGNKYPEERFYNRTVIIDIIPNK